MNATTAEAKPAARAAKLAEAKAAQPRKVEHISPARLELAEQRYNRWYGVAPAGTRPEDLDLQAEPFALIAGLLHRGDDLRLFTADDELVIDLMCVQAGEGSALCRVTQTLSLPKASYGQRRIPDGYVVRAATVGDVQGGVLVVRLSDNVLLNHGHILEREEDGIRFLLDHATVRGDTPQGVFRKFS